MMRTRWVAGWALLGSLFVSSTLLAAEQGAGEANAASGSTKIDAGPAGGMNDTISLLGSLGYAYSEGTGFGLGGRYQYTFVPEGVIHHRSIHDEFGGEAAFDWDHYSWGSGPGAWSYNEFGLSASLVWNIWFTERFAAYPRLGLGFAFGTWSDSGLTHPGGFGGLFFVGGAGVLYQSTH